MCMYAPLLLCVCSEYTYTHDHSNTLILPCICTHGNICKFALSNMATHYFHSKLTHCAYIYPYT